jgi:hypothetical protein
MTDKGGRNATIAAIAAIAIIAGAAGYGAGVVTGRTGADAGQDARSASADTGTDQTWIEAAARAGGERPENVIARQFRGLDVAMIEIEHRYVELYFAGQDRNWEYAEHQIEHMERAMDMAIERRPARAASARTYFYPALDRLEAVVEAQDADAFAAEFESFRQTCNACHVAEDEPAFVVQTPTARRTTIGGSG